MSSASCKYCGRSFGSEGFMGNETGVWHERCGGVLGTKPKDIDCHNPTPDQTLKKILTDLVWKAGAINADLVPEALAAIEKLIIQARIVELKNLENLSDGKTINLDSSHDNYILKVDVVKERIKQLEGKSNE